MGSFLVVLLCGAPPASAQTALSLSDAIARAKVRNPDVGSAAATEQEAGQRVTEVRSGYFPKVDVAESWQRGDSPLFAFSSRLAERRFASSDLVLDPFNRDALNHPRAADNFRVALSVEQPLFDRTIAANLRAASIGSEIAATGRQLVDQELTAAVTEAYGRVVATAATTRSAAAAVETARADLEVAGNRRDAGRATDADVLQMNVHLARALARQVQAVADEQVARARLNQLMGEPLDSAFALNLTPPPAVVDIADPAALEADALKNRPEVTLARQRERLAAAAVAAARAAFAPQISTEAIWELNGDRWNARSSSWMVGAGLQLNLFRGFADKARLAETRQQAARRAFERVKAETLARLDVRIAIARLDAARSSEVVGRTAADQSRETHRIVRDRYASGLADLEALLRSADAVEQADAQEIEARVSVLAAAAALQRAIGKR